MIRLVQITDTHIYETPDARFDGVDTRASCERVLAALRASGTAYDALVLSGDLAMDASAGAYAWLSRTLAGETAERFALPGNHDDPTHLREAGFATACAPACVRRERWRVCLLDTHVPGCAHGELDAARLAWLARQLDEPHAGWDAVFLHHHPLPIGSIWMDGMGLREPAGFWSVIDAHASVRMVAFGHVHQNFDCYRAGVRVLGTPSTCVQFMPRADRYAVDRRAPGYRLIALGDGGGVETSIVRIRCP